MEIYIATKRSGGFNALKFQAASAAEAFERAEKTFKTKDVKVQVYEDGVWYEVSPDGNLKV